MSGKSKKKKTHNFKTLKKKGGGYKIRWEQMKRHPCSWTNPFNFLNLSSVPKVIYKFKDISIKSKEFISSGAKYIYFKVYMYFNLSRKSRKTF